MKSLVEMKWDRPVEKLRGKELPFDPRGGYLEEEIENASAMAVLDKAIAAGKVGNPEVIRERYQRARAGFRTKEECRCVIRRFLASPLIYDIDPALDELLSNAKWKPEILSQFIQLPKGNCIGLVLPKGSVVGGASDEPVPEFDGLFVIVDEGAFWGVPHVPRALVIAMAPLGIPLAILPLVQGESLGKAYAARDGIDRGIDHALRERGEEVEDGNDPEGLRNFVTRYAINVLLYLLGEPDTVTEIHPGLPPTKKHRNKPAFAMRSSEVVTVGRKIGDRIRAMERYAAQQAESDSGGVEGTGKPVKAHLRSAHFHTYWAGKGRTEMLVHLLATILVNGKEHSLDELIAEGGVVKVR